MKENEIINKLIKHYKNEQTGGYINYYNILYYLINLLNIKTKQKIKLIISLKQLYNNYLIPDVIESTIGHDNFQFLEKTLHIDDILSGGKMDSDKYEYNMNMNVIIQYYNNHLLLINNEIKRLEHIKNKIEDIYDKYITYITHKYPTDFEYKRCLEWLNKDEYKELFELTDIKKKFDELNHKEKLDINTCLEIPIMMQRMNDYIDIINSLNKKHYEEKTTILNELTTKLDGVQGENKAKTQIENEQKENNKKIASYHLNRIEQLDITLYKGDKLELFYKVKDALLNSQEDGRIITTEIIQGVDTLELFNKKSNKSGILNSIINTPISFFATVGSLPLRVASRVASSVASRLTSIRGGSINFKQKYLKYKTLYLNLKNST